MAHGIGDYDWPPILHTRETYCILKMSIFAFFLHLINSGIVSCMNCCKKIAKSGTIRLASGVSVNVTIYVCIGISWTHLPDDGVKVGEGDQAGEGDAVHRGHLIPTLYRS